MFIVIFSKLWVNLQLNTSVIRLWSFSRAFWDSRSLQPDSGVSTGMCESFSLLYTFCISPRSTSGRYKRIAPPPSLLASDSRGRNTSDRIHRSRWMCCCIDVRASPRSPVGGSSRRTRAIARSTPSPLSSVAFARGCGVWVKTCICEEIN